MIRQSKLVGFADFFCGVFCGNSGTLRLFGNSGGGVIGEIENIGIIEAIGKIESIGAIDVFIARRSRQSRCFAI